MIVGDPIQFEFSSADASTAAVLVVRRAGNAAAITLGVDERVIISSLTAVLATGAGLTVIFSDADSDGTVDANERMVVLGEGLNRADFFGPDGGTAGALGLVPKVKATGAGQITIAGVGYLMKG